MDGNNSNRMDLLEVLIFNYHAFNVKELTATTVVSKKVDE